MDVAEIYSPPRMTSMAQKLGYTPGFSMELTTLGEDGLPGDLSVAATQRKALRRWETEKHYLLVASPPCTVFSALQNLERQARGGRSAGGTRCGHPAPRLCSIPVLEASLRGSQVRLRAPSERVVVAARTGEQTPPRRQRRASQL